MGTKTTFWNHKTFETVRIEDYAKMFEGAYHIQFANMSNNKLRVQGDGSICVHVDAVSKTTRNNINLTSFVFENDGDVTFVGCGEIRFSSLIFQNSGSVRFEYSTQPIPWKAPLRKTTKRSSHHLSVKARYLCCENGKSIISSPNVKFDDTLRAVIRNGEDANINSVGNISNMTISCGDKCFVRSRAGVRNCMFKSGASVEITSPVIEDCVFCNEGDVSFQYEPALRKFRITGRKTIFNNHGSITFDHKDIGLTSRKVEFYNTGNVSFSVRSDGTKFLMCQKDTDIVFKNEMSVFFSNIAKIRCKSMMFRNLCNVDINSLSRLEGTLTFMNRRDVVMRSMGAVYSPGYIYVKNYGKFIADKLTMTQLSTLHIASKGMVYLNKYIRMKGDKTSNCLIYTNDAGMPIYKTSFLRRYNVRVNEGKVILYKVVSYLTKTAPYDNIDTKWNVGDVVEHPNWSPTENEFGSGKYIATAVPETMYGLIPKKWFSVIALEIAIEDLFEWPADRLTCPQYIGFRKAKVIAEKQMKIDTRKRL